MELIQLKNHADGFASIDFSAIDMDAVLNEGKIELISDKSFKWNKATGEKISDCPFYIGALPIFDTNKLGTVLNSIDVKFSTFEVEGRNYTLVAAPHFHGEIINREFSEMRTFRSGKIMAVKKYVFNKDFEYPAIFTPAEFNLCTFCNKEIKRYLQSCHFTELKFEECQIMN